MQAFQKECGTRKDSALRYVYGAGIRCHISIDSEIPDYGRSVAEGCEHVWVGFFPGGEALAEFLLSGAIEDGVDNAVGRVLAYVAPEVIENKTVGYGIIAVVIFT